MKNYATQLALIVLFVPTVCAFAAGPQIGSSASDIERQLGRPTDRFATAAGDTLEYKRGPFGRGTYMAHLDKSGRLVSYEQVLSTERFALVQVGKTTAREVKELFGSPSATSRFPLMNLDAWQYPYQENGVWDSAMSIYFDQNGIVRKMESGPDPWRYQGMGGAIGS
jgi:hypothetical protein